MFLTAIFASSPKDLTSFTICFLLSSFNSGNVSLTPLPSLIGLTPSSATCIAFVIAPRSDLSHGVINICLASGTDIAPI